MPVRVSAAMIVRDEEKVLGDCLDSLVGCVDEIVIADTGSIDSSRDIARARGARVFDLPWTGDFSAARNAAIDAATGDWILYIDADERLHVPEGVRLSEFLDDPRAAAFTVIFQPLVGFTTYKNWRLWRNDPRVRFQGVFHETMRPGIEAVCREDGLAILDSAVKITHVGYEGDLSHKHRRNLPLLRKAVEERPWNIFCWQHLAETLAALGETREAIEACREAVELARRPPKEMKEQSDGSLAYQAMARLLSDVGEDALPIIEEGLRKVPHDRALLFFRARGLITAGREEEALTVLDRLAAEDPSTLHDRYTAYDVRIFGEFAQDLRGVALLRLARYDEAAEAFEKAAVAAPENLAYRTKAAAMRGRAARAATS
jgi:glycosyltransferase involved in cell wall biosynthesis